ncbi:MAG: hypothetical protein AAGF24_14850 [Cyanobacteria bacterium P01_H01_bin.121]
MSDNLLLQDVRPVFAQLPDALAVYALTREFRTEVTQRQDFETYCERYAVMASEHQADLQQMQHEFNVFACFRFSSFGFGGR